MKLEDTLADYIESMRLFPPSGDATWSQGFVVRTPEDLPREFPEGIIRKMAVAANRLRWGTVHKRRLMPAWLDFTLLSAHKGERVDEWMLRCVSVFEAWLGSGDADVPVLPRCPHCTPDAPCQRPRRSRSHR